MKISRISRRTRIYATALLAIFLFQTFSPTVSYALTDGPTQPEVQSFAPVSVSDMVDVFSGDFGYNIPLFELPGPDGGYPVNLHYNSSINIEDEASWVGLGWNINPGVINRSVRGLPDDFNGDEISTTQDMKNNATVGVTGGGGFELFGGDVLSGSGSLGLSIYYNNYNGGGARIDMGLGVNPGGDDGHTSFGFNMSFDTQQGFGTGATFSLRKKVQDADVSSASSTESRFTLGMGFNSESGLTTTTSISASRMKHVGSRASKDRQRSINIYERGGSSGSSATISFATPNYLPPTNQGMGGANSSVSISFPLSVGGTHSNVTLGGYFNVQWLKNKNKEVKKKAYGYMYMENWDEDALNDVNREKDGMVHETSPNLSSPLLAHDYFMVTGQGMSGMFRPYRSEKHIGFGDHKVTSESGGATGGGEVGSGFSTHGGVNISINAAQSGSGTWTANNPALQRTKPQASAGFTGNYPLYEKTYFMKHGEPTTQDASALNYMGEESAVRVALTGSANSRATTNTLEDGKGFSATIDDNSTITSYDRRQRNMNVRYFTNEEIVASTNQEVIGLFDVSYYDYITTFPGTTIVELQNATRSGRTRNNRLHHIGGIIATQTNGVRYVYGIPAYNTSEERHTYSVDDADEPCKVNVEIDDANAYKSLSVPGDEFKSIEKTPEYAHSYLLTAIVGPDYIDADHIPGPSDGDYGYWIKFTYAKTTESYQWRVPFVGANFHGGGKVTAEDNKASFSFGTKELWYLVSMESKTHEARYYINQSDRKDAKAAKNLFNKMDIANPSSYIDHTEGYCRLDSIIVKTKLSNERVKGIHFVYATGTDQLCQDIINYDGTTGKGKLTLKEVYFTYKNSWKGVRNRYKFNYENSEPYHYQAQAFDRWGVYRQPSPSVCENYESPYTRQFTAGALQSPAEKTGFKDQLDYEASQWLLKEIELPSGGKISINYERDDYAYVQHKPATQMFRITAMGDEDDGVESPSLTNIDHRDSGHPENWDVADAKDDRKNNNCNATSFRNRRVHFQLETPISTGLSSTVIRDLIYTQYLLPTRTPSGDHQLYFNIYASVKQMYGGSTNMMDFVAGYAKIQLECGSNKLYDVDPNSIQNINGQDYYTHAYITLDLPKLDKDFEGFHPFAVAAWQYIQTTRPKLMNDNTFAVDDLTPASLIPAIFQLFDWIPTLEKMFTGYRTYAFNRNYGMMLDMSRSYIRLGTPDGIKYGGGTRVQSLVMDDQWTVNGQTDQYGQVYDYTTLNEFGQTISSGVASYEPIVGGDENPMRYAKDYPQNIPFKTGNQLYFEYPVNESLYPGASVGYSKVTVKSLNTANKLSSMSPSGKNTSGVTVHEFYTAKDFPVITDETVLDIDKYELYIPVPFIGMHTEHALSGSQGYSIILNDMHGKPKSVESYAINVDGEIEPASVSSTKYIYRSHKRIYEGVSVWELDNYVDVLIPDPAATTGDYPYSKVETRLMGVEQEIFTDFRHSWSASGSGGVDINLEIIPPIGFPLPWPNFMSATVDLRQASTNKIIHKSGILEEVIVTDGQSTTRTRTLYYDGITGASVLNMVNNDYDDPVYTFDIPAYWMYEGMGPAYRNDGFVADIPPASVLAHGTLIGTDYYMNLSASAFPAGLFFPGDEFILLENGVVQAINVTFEKENSGVLQFHCTANPVLSGTNTYTLKNVRSGRRNMLSAPAGKLVTLKNPVIVGQENQGCSPSLTVLLEDFFDYVINTLPTAGYMTEGTYLDDPVTIAMFPQLANLAGPITIRPSMVYDEPGICNAQYLDISIPQLGYECNCQVKRDLQITGFTIHPSTGVISYYNGTTLVTLDCDIPVPSYLYLEDVLQASAIEYSDSWNIPELRSTIASQVYLENYYRHHIGEKGIWRAWKSYYYNDDRYQRYTDVNQAVALKSDGVFDGNVQGTGDYDRHFYLFKWNKEVYGANHCNWIHTGEITRYSAAGHELENRDLGGVYSAAHYGYNGFLPVAVGTNTSREELFFESFDDPTSAPYIALSASLSNNVAHTGNRSLMVLPSTSDISFTKTASLKAGKEYVFSCWLSYASHQTYTSQSLDGLESGSLNFLGMKVELYNGLTLLSSTLVKASGKVLESRKGFWRRIEGNITAPVAQPVTHIRFVFPSDPTYNNTFYFDDVRFFPEKGNMKSYVYDPDDFRLMSTMDENHIASFYYYDEEGNLYVTKVETEQGLKTIQESRKHLKKNGQ